MVTTQLRTAKDLWNLGDAAGDIELLAGELTPVTPPDFVHGTMQIKIGAMLLGHVESRQLGKVSGDAGFILERAPDTVLAPDLSFISASRLPDRLTGYIDIAPDLAVEIVSPGNAPGEIERKLAIYLQAGVRCVWIVYPRERQITVYEPDNAPRVYGDSAMVSGAPVLPELTFPAAALFD
ncbi:MAG: Uma2 family endonuclease [Thermomicrobiales bacterium]|nr:Uma2 family endonuclease [Thermomicrobiales bacterium]